MFFAINVRRVDSGFLQGSFNSFLYLFSFCLLDSHLDFLFFYRFRNTSFINSDRVHGCDLHSDIVSSFFRFLVECGDRTQLVLAHVVVNSRIRTFYHIVAIQFHFFTCDSATIRYSILYGTFAHRQRFHFIQSLALVSYSSIKNSLSQSYKIFILSYEVSFTLQSDDSSEFTVFLCQHATFSSFTVRTFSSNSLSFFTDNFHCFFDVTVRFGQSLLAVHHTSSTHFAQLGYISHSYSHNLISLFIKCLLLLIDNRET